jgi:hypothetical protein
MMVNRYMNADVLEGGDTEETTNSRHGTFFTTRRHYDERKRCLGINLIDRKKTRVTAIVYRC